MNYTIQIDLDKANKGRQQVFNELRESGVGVNVHYIPIHIQPYYRQFGFKDGDFPISESYYNRALTIPLFHFMTFNQQDQIVSILRKILQ